MQNRRKLQELEPEIHEIKIVDIAQFVPVGCDFRGIGTHGEILAPPYDL